jgi:hypothetical protein
MYSRVLFYRLYVLGESDEKARLQPLNPTLELYVKCYFESDWGRLFLASLRLRREIGRALGIDKIVGYLSRLMQKL